MTSDNSNLSGKPPLNVTIDGRTISAAPGTTVLQAALANGVEIPRLCHHPELSVSGGCRLCLVQVQGRPNPTPSCGLLCENGMVVQTRTELIEKMRRDIIDLFVSDHPLRCVVCDKNGACDLQKYAYQYGIDETSHDFEISKPLYQDDNPFFYRDHEMCILCGKCVRVCDEIVGVNAIEFADRSFGAHVATPFDFPMVDSTCVFCGSCVQVCPTAALMPVARRGKGREWELQRIRTVCGYCGVGCQVEYAVKDGAILYGQGFRQAPANGEFLCVKGRFGWDFAASSDRLTHPLVRRELATALNLPVDEAASKADPVLQTREGKNFVAVSWETALELVAARLAETVKQTGPDSVAGLSSARCTNEENYLFQKFMRATIGTNNVDHCARLCHASTVTGLGMAFGSGAMTNPIKDIRGADCILITGSNTAESHPVISYEVVRAVKRGANLLIIDPRRVPLVDHASLWLQPKPGTDQFVFLAMAHVILREKWSDDEFIRQCTENFDAFGEAVKNYTPELAELQSGVPAAKIEEAARMYALGERRTLDHSAPETPSPASRGHSTILYAMGITQRSNGTELVLTLANLALLTGQIGKPSTGINPLRGQSNVQGACDVGALPNNFPGYQMVNNPEARQRVAEVWGAPNLPTEIGLTVVEMMRAALEKKVRAIYIMGENPMLSDPDVTHVEASLKALDTLIVQDIFLTETAQFAHILLPAASWLEKDGTFTNTERRIQRLAPVLPAPGACKTDAEIVCELGTRVDVKLAPVLAGTVPLPDRWQYANTAAIMDELARATPIYRGVHHHRLQGQGLAWPVPADDHPGTPVLHREKFSRGLGKFHAIQAQLPYEQPDAEYPLILTTGRILYQYHTGTMTRRSEGLAWREPRGYAEINPEDAAKIGLRDGGWVIIKSRRGQVRTQARIGERVSPGVVFYSFHWKEGPANVLTQAEKLDPYSKIPEFKVSAVRLENPAAEHDAKKADKLKTNGKEAKPRSEPVTA
jgi:formate dehydrogenase alpha subunit